MGVLVQTVELLSGLAIFQSTTLTVLGLVSVLYLYRKLVAPNPGSQLGPGEVRDGKISSLNMQAQFNLAFHLRILPISCLYLWLVVLMTLCQMKYTVSAPSDATATILVSSPLTRATIREQPLFKSYAYWKH